jgi:hypothetical protein
MNLKGRRNGRTYFEALIWHCPENHGNPCNWLLYGMFHKSEAIRELGYLAKYGKM